MSVCRPEELVDGGLVAGVARVGLAVRQYNRPDAVGLHGGGEPLDAATSKSWRRRPGRSGRGRRGLVDDTMGCHDSPSREDLDEVAARLDREERRDLSPIAVCGVSPKCRGIGRHVRRLRSNGLDERHERERGACRVVRRRGDPCVSERELEVVKRLRRQRDGDRGGANGEDLARRESRRSRPTWAADTAARERHRLRLRRSAGGHVAVHRRRRDIHPRRSCGISGRGGIVVAPRTGRRGVLETFQGWRGNRPYCTRALRAPWSRAGRSLLGEAHARWAPGAAE